MLLWGPPGTGKTLMAEAVAGETGKPYVFVDPGAFTNMFMGVGILKVKRLFRKLRKLALRYGGVIVFFDEADALGNRGALAQAAARPAAWAACHGFDHSVRRRPYLSETALPRSRRPRGAALPVGAGSPAAPVHHGRHGRRRRGHGHAAGPAHRALRAEEAARLPQPARAPRARHAAQAAAEVPHPRHDGDEHAGGPRRGAAAAGPHRPDLQGRLPDQGRPLRTYEGYFAKVAHELTPAEIDKLATITPYATGATIKDLVNEALIIAIRDGREIITWSDVLQAKQLKELGPPEDVEYIERERHAVAVHEACHAVMAYRIREHLQIDIATIENGDDYLGMVASIPTEDQFTTWRSRSTRPTSSVAGVTGR